MKKVIFLILFLPLQAEGQIVENFESGSLINWVFSNPGRWTADQNSISGIFSLHHSFDNPDAGTDQAGVQLKNLHPGEDTTRWTFLIKYGCDPSSSNNWAVFLMSDSGPASLLPGGGVKGFAAGVNLTGSDDTLRIWKINGTSITPVVTSRINWQTNIGIAGSVGIAAERTPSGEWSLMVYRMNGQLIDRSTGYDNSLFRNDWFGIFYKYSSTRDRLLWLDDISINGKFYEDIAPPVASCRITGKSSLEISFNEEPDAASIKPENFTLNGHEDNPVVSRRSPLSYIISFSENFINKSVNTLILKHLCDKRGNCSENISLPFTPVFPEPGDVVITELMPDPLPAVSLPPAEYLEIRNRTEFEFNLKSWKLCIESREELIPESVLHANARMIICSVDDTAAFGEYGIVTGLKQFPLLNDSRMILSIRDSSGLLIHGIEFSREWYREQLKSNGGWSLEMIDENYPFFEEGNWRDTDSREGGTPGKENSVSGKNRDENFRGLVNVFPLSSKLIKVYFSEYVYEAEIQNDLTIDNGIGIRNVTADGQLGRSFIAELDQPLQPGTIYLLKVPAGMTDFAANPVERNEFKFGLCERTTEKDIIFNELLFNPLPGDADYIEFFNNSNRIVDASRLYVTSVNDLTGDTSSLIQISDEHRCILPFTFYTITTDRKSIIKKYFSSDAEMIFETASLPSMNDDKGHLVLFNRELDKIDEVYYDDQMHSRFLDVTEGISLERLSPGTLSTDRSAWHSASESSGWGTPGKENSMYIREVQPAEEIMLSSSKISPDNDGYEDVLVIDICTNEKENILSASIFDETGSLVRKLAERLLAGPGEELIWDGTADDGTLVRTGIYVIFIEMYNSYGKVRKWKKVCTVVR